MRKLIPFIILLSSFTTLIGQDLRHIKIDSVNSSYDEFNPVLSPDGQTLYVTKRGHAANVAGVIDQGDIWFATRTETGWTKLRHAGNVINHQGLNGVVGFSVDGSRMYLLNYFDPDGNGGGNLRQGISVSTLENGEWSRPERLAIKFFQNKSNHLSASISRDEKVLIISMASYTTEGNEDLYVSFRQDNGEWTQPESLGKTINTFAEEWTPYLAADNKTLYFASNGFDSGFGSRDIYVSKRQEGSWTEWSQPINLGPSINTEGVEMNFFIPNEGKEAFFSTTQNSEGMGDIFNFMLNEEQQTAPETLIAAEVTAPEVREELEEAPTMVVMNFQVLDAQTEQPIDAQVNITYGDNEKSFNTADLGASKEFMQAFEEGAMVYINISATGYLDFKTEFEAEASAQSSGGEFGSSVETFMLTKIEVGTSMTIDNVLFKRGSASFSNAEVAQKEIDKLIELMINNPDMQIRLEGHTDNRGDARILKSLSEDRVKTVRTYMVSKGIDRSRIEVVGFGGERPVAENDTSASREMNRRVEFVIIK